MSTYTPETTISYENLVKVEYARQCGKQVLDGALSVEIVAFFPVPKSESKKRTALMEEGAIYHTKKPDADNIAKCVLDAINGIAFKDDSQVSKMTVVKKYARQPHTTVKLAEMDK